MKRILATLIGTTLVGLPGPAVGQQSPNEVEHTFILMPSLDPSRFSADITNPYLAFEPGTRFIYEEKSDGETLRVEVFVTHDTKEVMGVTTRVVHDQVTRDGELVEDTFDWYAQDDEGNVWYFGEHTRAYRDGEVSSEGSWEAGVAGAVPGIVMLADPTVGDTYRQEYRKGKAEDMGQILDLSRAVTVAAGSYQGVLVTADWNPLEPGQLEHKFYAKGVGLVAEELVEGGSERVDLIEVRRE